MSENGSIIACIWDFDKTLTPGDMQGPLFLDYGIDESSFWEKVNGLPRQILPNGIRLSNALSYLNFLLALVRSGRLSGLSKSRLSEYGGMLEFFPGIPEIFSILKNDVAGDDTFRQQGIILEHYIVSGGHAEIIRGSRVAPFMEEIFACEFLEEEVFAEANNFCHQIKGAEEKISGEASDTRQTLLMNSEGIPLTKEAEKKEIRQIAYVVDNTQKTRCLFEINKGCNKNLSLDVNCVMDRQNRRIPFENMIYIGDGPSDIAAFSVVRNYGGKAFAVYKPDDERAFAQSDRMLEEGRIDAYGPADYRPESSTTKWIRMHVQKIGHRIVKDRLQIKEKSVRNPPGYLHPLHKNT